MSKPKSREGNRNGDDSWLHDLELADSIVSRINSMYRTMKKSIVYIDLEKGKLNTAKLVRKPVQVRGKDGKVFTRMQWVDPNKDNPVIKESSASELDATNLGTSGQPKEVDTGDMFEDLEMYPDLEATKQKTYDLSTQKGFIDQALDRKTREEKEKLLKRHDIQWKEHENANKNWMNAIMALKDYMYNHPELMDASHLPTVSGKDAVIVGIDDETAYCNELGREGCYELMKKYGLNDGSDPSKNTENKNIAAIKHMRNMMSLKAYLKENPHLMEVKQRATTSPIPSPAEKGGNDVNSIVRNMSDSQKYELMKELGIADCDPRKNPDSTPINPSIQHMRNVTELKRRIETDPSVLVKNNLGELRQDELDRIDAMNESQKKQHELKELVLNLSKSSKERLVKKWKNEPEMVNRKKYQDPNIDWKESMQALKEILSKDANKLQYAKEMERQDYLESYKITNKGLEKVLRGLAGLTTKSIDYTKCEVKNMEWSFGLGSSCMRQLNDDDEWVLSIVDTGDDGSEWNEQEIPMEEVIKFLSLKDSLKDKPLHERSLEEVYTNLNSNMKLYTPEVGTLIQGEFRKEWRKSHTNSISELINGIDTLSLDTASTLLGKWGIEVNGEGKDATFDCDSDRWLDIAYSDWIGSKKHQSALNYVVTKTNGEITPYVLHECAKKWSYEDKLSCRSDIIGSRVSLPEGLEAQQQEQIKGLLRESTDFIPLDLFIDSNINNHQTPLSIKMNGVSPNGKPIRPHYNPKTKTINLPHTLTNPRDNKSQYVPQNSMRHVVGGLSLGVVMAHETSHAIDHFFSDYNGYLNWNGENAQKYIPEMHRNSVQRSFNHKVEASNPNKQVVKVPIGKRGGETVYEYYYKDEWMNNYEGRVYGLDESTLTTDKEGNLCFNSQRKGEYGGLVGMEHFAECVERFSTAFTAYQEYNNAKASAGHSPHDIASMDNWATEMKKTYKELGLGDDWTQEQEKGESYKHGTGGKTSFTNYHEQPQVAAGYLYDTMKNRYPDMWKLINVLFNRPDYGKTMNVLDDKPVNRVSRGYTMRKGLYIEI